MQKPLTYYVDGSYLPRAGIGGYAVIPINDQGKVDHGKVVRVGTYTSGCLAMELQAAIEALRRAPTHRAVTIYSDCLTVVDVAARGHIKRCGDLKREWDTLLALVSEKPNVSLAWVRGHHEDELNKLADRTARAAAQTFTDKIRGWAENTTRRAPAPAANMMACVA